MTWLEALRHARKWTMADLAARAGVNPSTILRIEATPDGHAPRGRGATLAKLAAALGVPLTDVLQPGPPARPPAEIPTRRAVVTLPDFAAELNMSARTLRRVVQTRPDALPPPLPALGDRVHRWSRTVVDRWLEDHRHTADRKRPRATV